MLVPVAGGASISMGWGVYSPVGIRKEGQALWECPFSILPVWDLMGFTGLKVCMLRPLTLGIQAFGSFKAPVEH